MILVGKAGSREREQFTLPPPNGDRSLRAVLNEVLSVEGRMGFWTPIGRKDDVKVERDGTIARITAILRGAPKLVVHLEVPLVGDTATKLVRIRGPKGEGIVAMPAGTYDIVFDRRKKSLKEEVGLDRTGGCELHDDSNGLTLRGRAGAYRYSPGKSVLTQRLMEILGPLGMEVTSVMEHGEAQLPSIDN